MAEGGGGGGIVGDEVRSGLSRTEVSKEGQVCAEKAIWRLFLAEIR